MDPTIPIVKNFIVLDSDGKRVAVKYCTPEWPTVAAQSGFEKTLWQKTSKTNARNEAEITMFDSYTVVYKALGDLMFYVTGNTDENELILYAALQALYETLSILLRQQVDKKTVLENFDLVLLTLDEIAEAGIIFETEPEVIATRVTMRGADGGEVPASMDQTFSKAFASAKEHLARSLLR